MKRSPLLVLAYALGLSSCGSPGEAAKTDYDRMQGMWSVMAWETKGEPPPDEPFEKLRVEIAGDRLVFHEDQTKYVLTFVLNPAASPKTIDLQRKDEPPMPGIYELDGDTLKVCFNKGKERPKEFSIDGEGTRTLFVLKRQKS